MMNSSDVVSYFGLRAVQNAIFAYFNKHGHTEYVRDLLLEMESQRPGEFLEMICDFLEKESV